MGGAFQKACGCLATRHKEDNKIYVSSKYAVDDGGSAAGNKAPTEPESPGARKPSFKIVDLQLLAEQQARAERGEQQDRNNATSLPPAAAACDLTEFGEEELEDELRQTASLQGQLGQPTKTAEDALKGYAEELKAKEDKGHGIKRKKKKGGNLVYNDPLVPESRDDPHREDTTASPNGPHTGQHDDMHALGGEPVEIQALEDAPVTSALKVARKMSSQWSSSSLQSIKVP